MYFTPHLIAQNSTGQTVRLRSPIIWGPNVFVVPRAQCSFRRMDLNSRGRHAVQAVRLRALKEMLPHEDTIRIVKDHHGLGAGVWSFGYQDMCGAAMANARAIPESLIYQSMEDGVRLVSCLDGVEGQIWKDSSLVASRWWPSAPSVRQWQIFLRAAPNAMDDISQPEPVHIALRADLPLFEMDAERMALVFSPQKIVQGASLVGACAFMYLGMQYVRHVTTLVQAERKIDALSGAAGEILSQKRRALANMKAVKRFDVLGDPVAVLNGFESLSQTLAGQDFELKLVQVRGGGDRGPH